MPVPTQTPASFDAAPEANRKMSGGDLPAPELNLKCQMENIEEKLSASGKKLPSISDLQACFRVGESGMVLFEELVKLMAGEMTKRLEDNRGLKEELAKREKVDEDLEAASRKVAEQKKQLEWLPKAEKDVQDSKQRVEEVEAREQTLKARVEELSKAAQGHLEQLSWEQKRALTGPWRSPTSWNP